MLKSFWRFVSDVCWRIGAERLSIKFLLMSLQTSVTVKPVIELRNTPPIVVPKGPFNMEVLWEDKPLLAELGDLRTNDVAVAKHVHDIN